MSNIIELKSKGQIRRLAIQNPELFDEVVRAMGYMDMDTLKNIIAEEKSKWKGTNPDKKFACGVLAGIESIEFRVNEAQTKGAGE